MTTTLQAIYENGRLILPKPLPLPEKTRVRVTIDANEGTDATRASWLKLSEESLSRTWDNSDDAAFDALLKE
ncbi:MAG: antitoxin AF2212-like protein [Opitutales bacterium]|jgi:predicted DNA-binding antitoxin AbrB/MazE fold protein